VQVDGETDGRTDMAKVIDALHDYANASKREWESNADLLQWESVTGYGETGSHLGFLTLVQSRLLSSVKNPPSDESIHEAMGVVRVTLGPRVMQFGNRS